MIRDQFLKAFEPEVAVNVVHIGKSKKEASSILKKIVLSLTKDYYHLTDGENEVIYLKRREKS